MTTPSSEDALKTHLSLCGLKRFVSDSEYFAWQREKLSSADLNQLNRLVENKGAGDRQDEVAFYDFTAHPHILPILYSQRYDYYVAIAPLIAAHLGAARTILDFGCGPGILTTFYARQFPHAQVVGLDRSSASIAQAQQKAEELQLQNVRFECVDIEVGQVAGTYDAVVAAHALVQSEQDPGLPSQSWRTFERAHDAQHQSEFERRTGLGVRLDRLNAVMAPAGRMIVFEKTRQLARRVPLQRAFSTRGLQLLEQPALIRYSLVEEVSDDGPFYVLGKGEVGGITWDERPEPDEGPPFNRSHVKRGSTDSDAPLYENHWPSAQRVWEGFHNRTVIRETTNQEPDGRQLHVEVGTAEGFAYLYCANTFDQRQVVLFHLSRAAILNSYYQDIVGGAALL